MKKGFIFWIIVILSMCVFYPGSKVIADNKENSVSEYAIENGKAKTIPTNIMRLSDYSINYIEESEFMITIKINSTQEYSFRATAFNTSEDYSNLAWFNFLDRDSNFEILTLDIMPNANNVFLPINQLFLEGDTVLRIVIQDYNSEKLYSIFKEISISEYNNIISKSTDMVNSIEEYSKYKISVNLEYEVINRFNDMKTETRDLSYPIALSVVNLDQNSEMKRGNLFNVELGIYDSDPRGSLYIQSLDVTITDNGIGYLLESIFPEELHIAKLINLYSYSMTLMYSNGYKNHIYVKSWENTLYPGQIHSSYMQYQTVADVLGIELTLQFSDFYKFIPNPSGDILLYGGPYSNNRLEEFSFSARSEDLEITYFRLSNIGLYELPTLLPFDCSNFAMDFGAFVAVEIAPWQAEVGISLIESAFDSAFDMGGFVSTNEEFVWNTGALSFNQFISLENLDRATHSINILLDPKWIMISPWPNVTDQSSTSRYKIISLELRFGQNPYDSSIVPNNLIYELYIKRRHFYLYNNYPHIIYTTSYHTYIYTEPSGC